MAKLTAKTRAKIPTSKFAGPDRSYPIQDKAHAANAKARVAQFGSPALKARVDAAANKVLAGKGGGGAKKMTYAQDMASDKKAGIKEGSAKDKALDAKRGFPNAHKGGGGLTGNAASPATKMQQAKGLQRIAANLPGSKTARPQTSAGTRPPMGGSSGPSGRATMPQYGRGGGGFPQPGYKGGR